MVPPPPSGSRSPSAPGADPVTVRMFAGYADTPLWSSGGPVALADLDLPAELRSGLARWEAESYGGDGLLSGMAPPSGSALARWLADELGSGVAVELQAGSGEEAILYSSPAPPRSPAAAALLLRGAAAERALHTELPTGRGYAYAPLTGAVLSGHTDAPPSSGVDGEDAGGGAPPRG